jgi:molecular chaperone DnaJ
MIFTQTCDKCGGRTRTQSCTKCSSSGVVEADVSVQVNIPGGVVDGNVLRLGGMGNFVTHFMGVEQYTDAHLAISVTPHESLKLVNNDVVLTIQIPLIEALVGCIKKVDTIDGIKDINIKPKSRNSEEVIMPNLGVNRLGSQRVVLDVRYPDDITDLVDHLSKAN